MSAHRPYTLREYDPQWPQLYQRHVNTVQQILAPLKPSFYHVGSTAVPGMYAKPNIDIMIVVPNITVIKQFYKPLTEAGYTPHGDYSHINEEYFTVDATGGERTASIHVFQVGNPEIKSHVDFRDYLRTHPADRDRYAAVKRELFTRNAHSYDSYDGGKDEIIADIKARAAAWADQGESS